MPSVTPLKALYTGLELTALAEFADGDSLPIANGGTGSTTAAAARAALGLAIGSDIQAYDLDLASIAALVGAGYIRKDASGNWVMSPAYNYESVTVTSNRTLDTNTSYLCGSGMSVASGVTLTIPASSQLTVKYFTKELPL